VNQSNELFFSCAVPTLLPSSFTKAHCQNFALSRASVIRYACGKDFYFSIFFSQSYSRFGLSHSQETEAPMHFLKKGALFALRARIHLLLTFPQHHYLFFFPGQNILSTDAQFSRSRGGNLLRGLMYGIFGSSHFCRPQQKPHANNGAPQIQLRVSRSSASEHEMDGTFKCGYEVLSVSDHI